MRAFRNKREETFGAYNFGQYQIYVCSLSNTKGAVKKGITVLGGDTLVEVPFVLTKNKALEFSSYLKSIANGELPKSYRVGSFFMGLCFKFTGLKEGMLKGRISLSGIAWVTVKPSTALSCAEAIINLYSDDHA